MTHGRCTLSAVWTSYGVDAKCAELVGLGFFTLNRIDGKRGHECGGEKIGGAIVALSSEQIA
jgi:hypothetical protein